MPYDAPLANFGEKALARDRSATDGGKRQERFFEGFWLGRAEGTHEHIVAVAPMGIGASPCVAARQRGMRQQASTTRACCGSGRFHGSGMRTSAGHGRRRLG